MSHVFLSYSRADSAYVDQLARYIASSGMMIWVDRQGIGGGEQWRHQIVEAIRSARVFLLIVSPNSARSENVCKELNLAEGASIPILPVVIAPTEIPVAMQYQLSGVQMIELWRNSERGSQQLLAALTKLVPISREAARRPGAPTPELPSVASNVNLADLGGASLLDRLNAAITRMFGGRR